MCSIQDICLRGMGNITVDVVCRVLFLVLNVISLYVFGELRFLPSNGYSAY